MSNARFFFLYRYLLENTCEGHTAKGEDIRQAQGAIEALGTRRADAEARLRSFQQAHKAVLEAKAARDAQLAEVKAEISRREERIAYYRSLWDAPESG